MTKREQPESEELRHLRQDGERKRYHVKAPQKMGDIVNRLFARQGFARVLSASAFTSAWSAAVGARLAAHTRATEVKRGVLQVIVRNSAVLQELTFDKSDILRRLTANAAEHKITDLKFRVGSLD